MEEVLNNSEKEKFSLKKFLFGKIRNKISFLFIVSIFILMTIYGILIFINSENILQKEIESRITGLISQNYNHLSTYLESQKFNSFLLISEKEIIDALKSEDYEKLNSRLKIIANNYENIAHIDILNNNGRVVSSSLEEKIGGDKSMDAIFLEGKENLYIKNLHLSSSSGKVAFGISQPIVEDHDVLGVLLLDIYGKGIFEILENREGLGETGEKYLINREGYMISRSRFVNESFLVQKVETFAKKHCFEKHLQAEHRKLSPYLNYEGKNVYGGHSYFEETEWCLIIEISESEIFGDIKTKLLMLTFIIFLIFFVVVFFVAIFISKFISRPIRELSDATEEVEKENFKVRVNIKTGDELEKLGKTFNKTIESLAKIEQEHKEIERAKTEFLSITSHELRSPMTPMRGQLQMVLEGYFGKLTDKQKEALNIVMNNAIRLDGIIVDFLEISRIEAARLKFKFVKTNLTGHVNKLIKEMSTFMPAKKIKIINQIKELPTIFVDPDRTMQVLRNLLNNAVKFSPVGKQIIIDAKQEGNYILFSVQDNGGGISEKNQRKIFEPFFQIEGAFSRKQGGTGLGLSICKGIVESQNGKIWVKSQVGKGTTFYFTIPLTPVKEIKPIRVLFSSKENIRKKIEMLFNEMLGPIGKNEFEAFAMKDEIEESKLIEYVNLLIKEGVINKLTGEIFKEKIFFTFKIGGGNSKQKLLKSVKKESTKKVSEK